MEDLTKFNKEFFSMILTEIYSKYPNQRSFAKMANINRTYISKYINKKICVPPSAKILRRLAKASKGITTYQELMQICGYLEHNGIIITNKDRVQQILELTNGLTIQEINYLIEQLNKAKIKI